MKENFHVQFLGGGAAATPPCYPAGGWVTALPTATSSKIQAKMARNPPILINFFRSLAILNHLLLLT
jgi:hypothetical protein